jgi:hypothetical protein
MYVLRTLSIDLQINYEISGGITEQKPRLTCADHVELGEWKVGWPTARNVALDYRRREGRPVK